MTQLSFCGEHLFKKDKNKEFRKSDNVYLALFMCVDFTHFLKL